MARPTKCGWWAFLQAKAVGWSRGQEQECLRNSKQHSQAERRAGWGPGPGAAGRGQGFILTQGCGSEMDTDQMG